MKKRKRPADLATARKKIAQISAKLGGISELMETIASLDLFDQRPLFWKQGALQWELKELQEDEDRLVGWTWHTAEDPLPMWISKE